MQEECQLAILGKPALRPVGGSMKAVAPESRFRYLDERRAKFRVLSHQQPRSNGAEAGGDISRFEGGGPAEMPGRAPAGRPLLGEIGRRRIDERKDAAGDRSRRAGRHALGPRDFGDPETGTSRGRRSPNRHSAGHSRPDDSDVGRGANPDERFLGASPASASTPEANTGFANEGDIIWGHLSGAENLV